jgi:putative ABC transporter-associated repeat protein
MSRSAFSGLDGSGRSTVFSYEDGVVNNETNTFFAGHRENRVSVTASAYGIYCVPITWSTTTAAGETSATTTLTYVFGSDDPDAEDYVDRSKVVPCAQGGSASEPSGGDDDEPAPDLAHVPNHSQTDSGQLIINVGHVDVASQLVSGELVTKIKDTSESVIPEYHSTDDVVLQLLPDSESAVPDSAEFAFLGASGAPLWQVTQTQQEDLIWPGWSTEEIPVEATTGGIDWTLARMEGPGAFVLYELGDFGVPHVLLNTRDGVTAADKLTIPKNTHAHGSWAFSAEGVYCLGFTRSATLTDGTNVSNDFTLAFAVGNVDVKSVNPAGCFSEGADPDPTDPDPTDPDPTDPDPTDPDPTDPDPTDPDQDGDDDPDDPTPTPDAVWDVPNGTVNNKGATVLNAGHVDIASLLEDGKLDTKIKDTTSSSNPVWRDTGKTVLQLLPDSATAVPANSAYHFLGDTGATIYQVTQTQQAGLLWPGWSTEAIPLTATQGGVDWSLLDSTGPGEFALYETDSFGQPKVHFNTRDGITAADKLTIPKNTHAHGSWAFSAEGVYCLAMQRSTQLPSGQTVTDEFSLAVAVGTADVMDADPASCAGEGTVPDPGDLPPDPNDTTPDPEDTTPADNGDSATTVVKPPAAKKCVSGAMILSSGHIDYATRIVGGKLRSLIGDGTASKKVYREPSGTVLWLKPASKVTLPSGYGQIGAAGSSVWQVPQTQKSGLIWLGWSTESLSAANVQGPVTWKINKVSGPGTMKVYLSGAFGGIQAMIFNNGGSYSIPLGVHAHANWAFSAQGIYRIKMTQTATLANGKVSSDTDTLTIAVGNVDPAKAGSGSGCGTVSNATLLSNEDLETELESTEPDATDAADAAITAPDWLPEQQSPARDEDEPPIVPAPPQNDPVPVLLVTLGVLLLLGAAGTGLLWWRRRKNAGPRA